MLKAFIIEDEIPAQINLKRAIANNFDDVEVVGKADSVTAAVEWLNSGENYADIIFMDVELSDGMCFEIFDRVDIDAHVIITTAYDSYAIKAFKVNSVDYLLKPIDPAELVQAVDKCRGPRRTKINPAAMAEALAAGKESYKKRFAIRVGDKIVVVSTSDIAYICSEDKSTCLVTSDNKRYVIDQTLDTVDGTLDPDNFFRISRSYIVSLRSIRSIIRHLGSRLKVSLEPRAAEDVFVSRARVPDFIKWLEGED